MMTYSRKMLPCLCAGLLGFATSARATTIYYNALSDPTVVSLSGQGLGAVTTVLTVHQNNTTIEQGCVGFVGGVVGDGSSSYCGGENTLNNGTGAVAVVGGDESSPAPDSVKNKAVTFGSLGITNANQIGVIFNGGTSGGSDVVLDDVSFKFYDSTGNLLLDLSDSFGALAPQPGQGKSGYFIEIDPTAMCGAILCTTAVNNILLSTDYFAMDTYAIDDTGSEEDFQVFNTGGTPPPAIPEPSSLVLLGTGLFGAAVLMRRRAVDSLV